MKQIYIKFTVFLLITISCVYANSDKEQQRVNEFFLRHIRQAHPMPSTHFDKLQPLVPLAAPGQGFSNFLNVSTTVDEVGQYRMQNESSIAVNPQNKMNLIASAVDYRDTSATWVYVSDDGGRTWVNHKLGRPYPGWTASNDPSVAFGQDGTGYLCVGGFGERSNTNTQAQIAENGIFVARTTDEGKTWEAHIPVIVHRGTQTIDSTFEDKYYIWSDNSEESPYLGNLYISWKRVWPKDSATQIVISKSTNKGSTWSEPLAISHRLPGSSEDTTYGQSFPLPVTGPNGELYVVWNNGIEHAVGLVRSMDGGETFTQPRMINNYNIFGITREIEPNIWRHTVKTKVRAETYPCMVADITNGPRRGWLYLTWAGDNIPNIYFSRSTDMGDTWSEPVIVHSDTTNDQLWQWIALDRTNGDIAVMYLDSRDDPENILTSTYVSYSSDGGTTWIDRRAADISGDLRKNPFSNNSFAGDYSGCAFHDGIVYPSWIDMRSAETNIFDSDVYTAIVDVNSPAAPGNFDALTIPDEPDKIKLQWETVDELSFGQKIENNQVKYLLKRNGQQLAVLDGNLNEYFDEGLSKFELYRYSIRTIYKNDTSGVRTDSAWAGGSREPGIAVLNNYERNEDRVLLRYTIPDKRLDDVTPFVNPKEIKVLRNGQIVKVIEITPEQTGKIIEINDIVPENGFFNYSSMITDSYENFGPLSEPKLIYAGLPLKTYSDDFDEALLRSYIVDEPWGLTGDFSYSGGALADSPGEDYKPLVNNSILIFPYEGNDDVIQLSFVHAAIVQQRDTALVEWSDDNMKTWKVLEYYDMTMYEPWADDELNELDWKHEQLTVPVSSPAVYFRFRIKSNATRQDKGWFIDELLFSGATSVDELLANDDLKLYPNPARDFVNIAKNSSNDKIKSISICDLPGRVLKSKYVNVGDLGYITLNIDDLMPGVYQVIVTYKNGITKRQKFVKQ